MDLFSYHAFEKPQRLAKNDLKSIEHRVLRFLKTSALGKKNAVSGKELMHLFDLNSTAEVRKIIKSIRTSDLSNTIVASSSKGYYIPYKDEYIEGVSLMLNRTLSMVETMIALMPASAEILHKAIGHHYKTTEKAVEGQTQMQFKGWEREVINKYAEKYERSE